MQVPTRSELLQRIEELKEENKRLQKNKSAGGAESMAGATKRELLERIGELEKENENLQSQLDEIAEIAAPEGEEGEDEGE